jgi:hypothetical protein
MDTSGGSIRTGKGCPRAVIFNLDKNYGSTSYTNGLAFLRGLKHMNGKWILVFRLMKKGLPTLFLYKYYYLERITI